MLLMLWLVLCTGLNLINIPLYVVGMVSILFLILDIVSIVKLWELIDRIKSYYSMRL